MDFGLQTVRLLVRAFGHLPMTTNGADVAEKPLDGEGEPCAVVKAVNLGETNTAILAVVQNYPKRATCFDDRAVMFQHVISHNLIAMLTSVEYVAIVE